MHLVIAQGCKCEENSRSVMVIYFKRLALNTNFWPRHRLSKLLIVNFYQILSNLAKIRTRSQMTNFRKAALRTAEKIYLGTIISHYLIIFLGEKHISIVFNLFDENRSIQFIIMGCFTDTISYTCIFDTKILSVFSIYVECKKEIWSDFIILLIL